MGADAFGLSRRTVMVKFQRRSRESADRSKRGYESISSRESDHGEVSDVPILLSLMHRYGCVDVVSFIYKHVSLIYLPHGPVRPPTSSWTAWSLGPLSPTSRHILHSHLHSHSH